MCEKTNTLQSLYACLLLLLTERVNRVILIQDARDVLRILVPIFLWEGPVRRQMNLVTNVRDILAYDYYVTITGNSQQLQYLRSCYPFGEEYQPESYTLNISSWDVEDRQTLQNHLLECNLMYDFHETAKPCEE